MDGVIIRRHAASGAGYSLIEVLVASVVVAVFIVGIFTVISNGSELNRREMLRRRVFQELERILEKPEYSSRSPYYINLAATGGYGNLPQVTLDSAANAPLKVAPAVKVEAVTFTYGTVTVPAKKVTARIVFTDKGTAYAESLQTIVTLTDIN